MLAGCSEIASNELSFVDFDVLRTFFSSRELTKALSKDLCEGTLNLVADVWSRSVHNPESQHYVPDGDKATLVFVCRRLKALEQRFKDLVKAHNVSRSEFSAKLDAVLKAQSEMRKAQEEFNAKLNAQSVSNQRTPSDGGDSNGHSTVEMANECLHTDDHIRDDHDLARSTTSSVLVEDPEKYVSSKGSWGFDKGVGLVWTQHSGGENE